MAHSNSEAVVRFDSLVDEFNTKLDYILSKSDTEKWELWDDFEKRAERIVLGEERK